MAEGKPKTDKFDEYGQLAIGYDMAKARAWVLKHAQKNLPGNYAWLQGLQLTWEITSAEFKEGQDAYEVVVSCYPEGAEVRQKGEWLYHVDVRGQLMPGTPVLRTALKHAYTRPLQVSITYGMKRVGAAVKHVYTRPLPGRSVPPPSVASPPSVPPIAPGSGAPATERAEARMVGSKGVPDVALPRETTPAPTRPVAPTAATPAPVSVPAATQMRAVPSGVVRAAIGAYAGFWVRFVATVVDVVLSAGLGTLLTLLTRENILKAMFNPSTFTEFVTGYVVGFMWIWLFWIWRGQTPGKWLLGVKITTRDGSRFTPGKAAQRYLVGYTLSWLTLGMGFLIIAFDKEKRGLHDRIAGTRVVVVRKGT